MPVIFTAKGNPVLVDEEDFKVCFLYSWQEIPGKGKTYIQGVVDGRHVLLHRFIMQPPDDRLVDHENGDTFDNRRANLREATVKQNARNRVINKSNRTGFKGVTPTPSGFRARIWTDAGRLSLGSFPTAEQAHAAYVAAAQKHHGEFARAQ